MYRGLFIYDIIRYAFSVVTSDIRFDGLRASQRSRPSQLDPVQHARVRG